ncbi:MAG: YkvA family protein [Anaerolineales bacterium]
MANRNSGKFIVPSQGGAMRGFVNRLKLIGRLMADPRVNIFIKTLPLASLAYLIWPLDAIALPVVGILDDAAILWIGSTLFVELCPDNVVQEHMRELGGGSADEEIVDADSTDINDNP